MSAEAAARHLLVDTYPKRGILVELSYPHFSTDVLSELKQKIDQTLDPSSFMFLDIDPSENIIISPSLEGEDDSLADDYSQYKSPEVLFLEKLIRIHNTKKRIADAINSGTTVIVSHYIFDLLMSGFAENAFNCRTFIERMSMLILTSYLKDLMVPDLVLSFSSSPTSVESAFLDEVAKIKDPITRDMVKDDKNLVLSSKIFQREAARDFVISYFDSTRSIGSDLLSLSVHALGGILSNRCQKERTKIKFY